MKPIQDAQKAVVASGRLMMVIVKAGLIAQKPRKLIATMMDLSDDDGRSVPKKDSEYMRMHQERAKVQRQNIGNEHFQRMAICSGEGDRRLELMVNAMNLIEKRAEMKDPVAVEKQNFLHQK